MICQGASERNISFLVEESLAEDLVRRLHRLFFQSRFDRYSAASAAHPMCQAGGCVDRGGRVRRGVPLLRAACVFASRYGSRRVRDLSRDLHQDVVQLPAAGFCGCAGTGRRCVRRFSHHHRPSSSHTGSGDSGRFHAGGPFRTSCAAHAATVCRADGGTAGGKRSNAGRGLDVVAADSGMRTLGWIRTGQKDAELAARARERGLEVSALSDFTLQHPQPGALILGFAGCPAAELQRGVGVLAGALADYTPASKCPASSISTVASGSAGAGLSHFTIFKSSTQIE